MSNETILWIIFGASITVMLTLDLSVFQRRTHAVKVKEALLWSAVWIGLALLFDLAIHFLLGSEKALLFLTGYITEKSLSVDNLFVFFLIFSYFSVPPSYQHKVLFWGIIGALIMRGIFIVLGLTIIERFHWSIYAFGAFLIYTGIRLSTGKELKFRPEGNVLVRLFRRFVPLTLDYHEDRFFIKENGRRLATLLFFVVVVVETTDIMFAVDSVPAVLAVTLDPFIVYSSNVFAILGLRALYFAIAGVIQRLRYLNYGLSVVLIFLGAKMVSGDFYKIPTPISLGVIAGILLVSVAASIIRPKKSIDNGQGV